MIEKALNQHQMIAKPSLPEIEELIEKQEIMFNNFFDSQEMV